MAQGIRKAFNEDQMIVDVVKYFSFKLYEKSKVVFISNDHYARLFAKHNSIFYFFILIFYFNFFIFIFIFFILIFILFFVLKQVLPLLVIPSWRRI